MADLTKFVNSALKQGESFDVYMNRFPKIGSGKANTLQTLHANLTIDASALGHSIKGEVDIVMPDTSPSGSCTINLLGTVKANCPYQSSGNKLVIQIDDRSLSLYGGDKSWSWLDISGIPASIGIWPTSKALMDEDEEDLAGVTA